MFSALKSDSVGAETDLEVHCEHMTNDECNKLIITLITQMACVALFT